jgi:hypothetical protein
MAESLDGVQLRPPKLADADGVSALIAARDAANETGATRLYERAGMPVTPQYDVHEREL